MKKKKPETGLFIDDPDPMVKPQLDLGIQRLIQPINDMRVGMGFKSPLYKQRGIVKSGNGTHMDHFGADWWQAPGKSKVLWAMGNGTVIAAGLCSTFGNSVVVRYNKCLNHRTGEVSDVIVRCFHMASIAVKKGQAVTTATKLGVIGCTGKFCNGVHVHIEIDTDVMDPLGVPAINPTNLFHWVSKNSVTIQDPAAWVHTKCSAPDNQSVASAGAWYRDAGRDGDCFFPCIV